MTLKIFVLFWKVAEEDIRTAYTMMELVLYLNELATVYKAF